MCLGQVGCIWLRDLSSGFVGKEAKEFLVGHWKVPTLVGPLELLQQGLKTISANVGVVTEGNLEQASENFLSAPTLANSWLGLVLVFQRSESNLGFSY